MSCLYILPRESLRNGNPWGRHHFQALLCCASQGCCKENAFLFSNNCFHFNLQMMWKCFCWPWVWLKLVFTNGRTKLRQPQSFGSPGSSAWDVLLLKPGVQTLPRVRSRVRGKACPAAADLDASQNCSPAWSFSSLHCPFTARSLAHMARI